MERELEAAPRMRLVAGMGPSYARATPPVDILINRPRIGLTRTILIAIEDPDEVSVLSYGLKAAGIRNPIGWFKDGTALTGHLARSRTRERSHGDNGPLLLALDTSPLSFRGIDTLKWIREQPQFAKLPVIAVTGTKHPEETKTAYEAGACWHLSKSSDFSDLMRLARRIREFWSYAVAPDFHEQVSALSWVSIRDILPPLALKQRHISINAPVPHLRMSS